MTLRYELLATDGAARRGRVHARHGTIETPAFMPVGTYGTVKAMTPEELEGLGAEIVLGNTFHLMLRPGAATVAELGGLHRFMHWSRPILTDSGGFQVFSLAKLRKMDEQGVRFRSPVDGAEVHLTPESSMDVQRALGSDIAMMFDDCTAWPATHAQAQSSMERSMRWARRCKTHYYRDAAPGDLFGIVQGGMYDDLRLASLDSLLELDLPGLAVGGLAVGEPEPERLRVLETVVPRMPRDRPRYLMGVGRPEDIVAAEGLAQIGDSGALAAIVSDVLAANPDAVAQYRAGKQQTFGFLVGQVMKASKGKANPQLANQVLRDALAGGDGQ